MQTRLKQSQRSRSRLAAACRAHQSFRKPANNCGSGGSPPSHKCDSSRMLSAICRPSHDVPDGLRVCRRSHRSQAASDFLSASLIVSVADAYSFVGILLLSKPLINANGSNGWMRMRIGPDTSAPRPISEKVSQKSLRAMQPSKGECRDHCLQLRMTCKYC